MANAGFIGYAQHTDDCVLTASSVKNPLIAANMRDDQLSKVWRTASGLTTAYLLLDLNQTKTVDVVALVGTNFSTGTTIRVRASLSDVNAVSSLSHDSGTVSANVDSECGLAIYLAATAFSARYMRIDITDASANYLQAGRLAIMQVWRFDYSLELGAEEEFADLSSKEITEDGHAWVYNRTTLRRFNGALPALTESDYENKGRVLARRVASKLPTLFCKDSSVSKIGKSTLWGTLDRGLVFRYKSTGNAGAYYTTQFTMTEQL